MAWDPRGCDMHARPRGRATRTHAGACVARMWRRCVAGPCESTRTLGWHLCGKRVFGLASDGPMSIVGPSNSIGAVTQMQKGVIPFIPLDLH